MTRGAIVVTILVACGGYAFTLTGRAAGPDVPLIKYKAEVPLQLPEGMYFGEVPGVAVNSKGHVFVYSRSDLSGPAYTARASQVLEFDQHGKFVREIGRNLYAWGYAHQIRIDKDDNIWAIDKGTSTIVKFTPDGRFADIYGRPVEVTEYRSLPPRNVPVDQRAPVAYPGRFNQETDIAWDSKGNSYVSDGYLNARVVKISGDGYWIKTWGERGTGPSQFLEPHQLVIDRQDRIYVGDRGNARIQVFDTDGKFLRQFTLMGQVPPARGGEPPVGGDDPTVPKAYPDKWPWGRGPAGIVGVSGAPMALCITPGPNQVLYVADTNPSRIYKVSLDGQVLGMLGGYGREIGQFRTPHQLTCADEHTLWVADMFNWRVQKITME